jgi:hypothetical protein
MKLIYKYKKYYKEKRYEKKSLIDCILFLPINIYFFINERVLPTKISILITFKRIYGFFPNLKNPKTMNEKLQWKKLYGHKKIYQICSDKYSVRKYIEKKIGGGYLVPLLFHTDNPERIPFKDLPKSFVIKANHGGGMTYFVKDKKKANYDLIKKICKKWLKTNFYYLAREWQYKNIKPKILIEKMLLDKEGKIPADLKFNCFRGKVHSIQVDTDRFGNHKRTYFWPNWKLAHFNWCEKKEFGEDPANDISPNLKKPKNLKKMIEISEKLSKDFDYVRVDLYNLNGKIYFGELTFSHGAGYLTFFPEKYDKLFGALLKLEK